MLHDREDKHHPKAEDGVMESIDRDSVLCAANSLASPSERIKTLSIFKTDWNIILPRVLLQSVKPARNA